MRIDRIISIIMLLNDKDRITAKELSERFEVSTKTIQRDIEAIELAGIPIVSFKGHEGGYGIIDSYKINKASMTKNELSVLKSLLKGVNDTYKNKAVISLIDKISSIDNEETNSNNFIIDFSRWGKSKEITEKINVIDSAINRRNIVSFNYIGMNNKESNRMVEPYKIIFKALNWYLYGYCTCKNDVRIFKLTRINELKITREEYITREIDFENIFKEQSKDNIDIILKVNNNLKNSLDDIFQNYEIIEVKDCCIMIKINTPYNKWIDSMVLSLSDNVEVIEPSFLRKKIKEKIFNMNNLYK